MKTFLLTCLCCSALFASAQYFMGQRDLTYPPLRMMPYGGFQLNENGELKNTSKYTSVVTEKWDGATGKWIKGDSTVCYYNAQMLMVTEISYRFGKAGWTMQGKGELVTDAKGDPQTNTRYKWKEPGETWQAGDEKDYVFDATHRLVNEKEKNRRAGKDSLINNRRNEYAYDSAGNEVKRLSEVWDSAAGWKNSFRELKVYGANRHLISLTTQSWDVTTGDWRNSQLQAHKYDQAGNEIIHDKQVWKNGAWQDAELDSSWYDAGNRQILQKNYRWSVSHSSEGHWVLNIRQTWVYNDKDHPQNYTEYTSYWNAKADSFGLPNGDSRTFDKDGNLLVVQKTHPLQGKLVTTSQDSVAYDRYGNVIYFLQEDRSKPREPGNRDQNFRATRYLFYYLPYDALDRNTDNGLQALLYPDPSNSHQVNIGLNADANTNINIRIFDKSGKKAGSEARKLNVGANHLLLSYPAIAPGTYRIELSEISSGKKNTLQWVVR